jgi:hypothetical protein
LTVVDLAALGFYSEPILAGGQRSELKVAIGIGDCIRGRDLAADANFGGDNGGAGGIVENSLQAGLRSGLGRERDGGKKESNEQDGLQFPSLAYRHGSGRPETEFEIQWI